MGACGIGRAPGAWPKPEAGGLIPAGAMEPAGATASTGCEGVRPWGLSAEAEVASA